MKKRFVVLENGKKIEITGEKGKFYICKNQMFRKANPTIKIVETEVKEKKEVVEEKKEEEE